MFPMISTLMELRQAKMVLNDVMEELEDEGIAFRRDIPVGMMVEVPAAAIMADRICQGSELFLDRNQRPGAVHAGGGSDQRAGGRICSAPAHPAVLRLLRDVIRAGLARESA